MDDSKTEWWPAGMKMKLKGYLAAGAFSALLVCGDLGAQSAAVKGLPPRPAPTDYQSVAKTGNVTLAAEFAGHGVPTADGVFANEEWVMVEVAVFGPKDTRLKLSYQDFSLKINGKKSALAAQPFEMSYHSLKDPEWTPPVAPEGKSKTGINGGGGGGGQEEPPAPVKMPMNLRLAMEQKARAAALPEGERPLPAAGLLFFQHGGKVGGIKSVELIYNGPAGKATLPLQ